MSLVPTCPHCDRAAQLVTGDKIYRGRLDLAHLNFWVCPACPDVYVGCHKAGSYRWEHGKKIAHKGTEPLGRMANYELRRAKGAAHEAFDPLWKSNGMSRKAAYSWLAHKLGISEANCHIGMFDVDQCRAVVAVVEAWRKAA